jgi:predicted metal-binding membrane protein
MSSNPTLRRPFSRMTPVVVVFLVAAALVTWIVTVIRMRGMDAGPGTDLGGLGWYVGVWVTMMAAMMLPSAMPMVLLFQQVSGERQRRGQSFVPTWVFVLSYLAVWTLYGLAAYGLYRGARALDLEFLDWNRGGPYAVGALIALAGLYELTPLKSVCLRHCRSPLHFILGGWRSGWAGALRMGTEHGAYCVGCCWGLMILLFALGVMSLLWMAVVAALIFAQKLLPKGEHLTGVFAVIFLAAGSWVAAAPASVPGLTQPNSPAANQSRMRMMGATPGTGMNTGAMNKPMAPARAGGCSSGQIVSTASYVIALQIGPAQEMYTAAQVKKQHPKSGELMLGGTMSAMHTGMASTRHLEVHICSSNRAVVTSARPTITIDDPSAKTMLMKVPIATMEGIGMGKADYHYGNNVELATGHHVTVTVKLNGEQAVFHVRVASSGMAMKG